MLIKIAAALSKFLPCFNRLMLAIDFFAILEKSLAQVTFSCIFMLEARSSGSRTSIQGRKFKFYLGGGCQHALDRLNFSGPTERIWAVRYHWEL